MSSSFVEEIHERIKSELDRLKLSMAEAARKMGDTDSQGLRDVCGGRKRAGADLIAKLMMLPEVDVQYILTGERTAAPTLTARQEQAGYAVEVLSKEEQALLDNYRHASEVGKKAIQVAGDALAQPGYGKIKIARKVET